VRAVGIHDHGAPGRRPASAATGFRSLIERTQNGQSIDAVTAGLTLPHSSGPVEGNVNRIKMLKRQMYGRAGFDLLRKRVLPAP
jgi:transposase